MHLSPSTHRHSTSRGRSACHVNCPLSEKQGDGHPLPQWKDTDMAYARSECGKRGLLG